MLNFKFNYFNYKEDVTMYMVSSNLWTWNSGKGKVNYVDARGHMIQLAEAPAQFKKGFWGVDLGSEDQDVQVIGMDFVGIMEACYR